MNKLDPGAENLILTLTLNLDLDLDLGAVVFGHGIDLRGLGRMATGVLGLD